MNAVNEISYPSPSDKDLEEVHCALSVGATLWTRGDEDEALKWLRRAAEAAADGDEDLRAVELFKAAADITTNIEQRNEKSPTSKHSVRKNKSEPPAGKWSAAAARKRRVHRRFSEDDQEATMVRPETALRRALTRIDPNYPQRIDFPEEEAARQSSLPGPTSDPFGHTPAPASSAKPQGKSQATSSVTNALDLDDITDSSMPAVGDDTEPRMNSQRRDQVSEEPPLPSSKPAIASSKPPAAANEAPTPTARRSKTLSVDAAAMAADSIAIGHAKDHADRQDTFPALRVALLPLAEEGEVRLLFISGDEKPPPGVTTCMLVATTPKEARLLRELYRTTEAKL